MEFGIIYINIYFMLKIDRYIRIHSFYQVKFKMKKNIYNKGILGDLIFDIFQF